MFQGQTHAGMIIVIIIVIIFAFLVVKYVSRIFFVHDFKHSVLFYIMFDDYSFI